MPITFGAVGDIISVCLLVKDLVDCLDKARGSKAEYQSLTRELWILDRVLLEIDLIARTHGGGASPELEALCVTAKKAVDECKVLVSDFLKRLKTYQSSFEEGGPSTNLAKTTAMKFRWRISEKDEVERFRAAIAGTSSSLQMLLAIANVKLLDLNKKEAKEDITAMQQSNRSSFASQDSILVSIQGRIDETNRLITTGNSVTSKIADALRLDWLQQLGTELKGYMRRIIVMNVATYHAVIAIQSALPGRLERSLIEEPFIFEDAIGRVAPVHLQWVTSWEAFNDVLEHRFKDIQGLRKVKRRQYGLQVAGTGRDIEQSMPWQCAFLPGQRVEMSMIFNSEVEEATCPGCHTVSNKSNDTNIQCLKCNIWFRRVTDVEEDERLAEEPTFTPWATQAEFGTSDMHELIWPEVGEPGFTTTAWDSMAREKIQKKREFSQEGDEEEDVRVFKRVKLVGKKKRTAPEGFEGRERYPITPPSSTHSYTGLHQLTSSHTFAETAQSGLTRKLGACIRCRMQRIRCNPDPYDPTGACKTCVQANRSLARTSFKRFPCLRYKITDAELLVNARYPRPTWTTRWKTMKILDITNWASAEIKTIDLTQEVRNTHYKLNVRKFVPVQGDALSRRWVYNGVQYQYECAPYAIVDMRAAGSVLSAFNDATLTTAIPFWIKNHTLLQKTYAMAYEYSRSAEREGERTLLRLTLRLWGASRILSRSNFICGEETLGMKRRDYGSGAPNTNRILCPPVLSAQIEIILVEMILEPTKKELLLRLKALIMENTRRSWLALYLCIFILLHSCALLTARDHELARSQGVKARFFRPQVVDELHNGAKILLAHFHYVNRGHNILDMDWDSKDHGTLAADTKLEHLQFMRETLKDYAEKAPHFRHILENDIYEDDYYFIAQLYERDWKPRHTVI